MLARRSGALSRAAVTLFAAALLALALAAPALATGSVAITTPSDDGHHYTDTGWPPLAGTNSTLSHTQSQTQAVELYYYSGTLTKSDVDNKPYPDQAASTTENQAGDQWTVQSGYAPLDAGNYTVVARIQHFSPPASQPTIDAESDVLHFTIDRAGSKHEGTFNGYTNEPKLPDARGCGSATQVRYRLWSGNQASSTATPLDDKTLTCTNRSGKLYYDYPGLDTAQQDGAFTAEVQQVDGQHSDTGLVHFTLDTVPPTVTISAPADQATNVGTSPTYSGTGGTAPGDQAAITGNVYAGTLKAPQGTAASSFQAFLQSNSSNWTAGGPALAPGTYTLFVAQWDLAGNTGFAVSHFTVGNGGTAAGSISITSPADMTVVKNGPITLTGTAVKAAPGDKISFDVAGGWGTQQSPFGPFHQEDPGTTTNGTTAWSFTNTSLGNGQYTLFASEPNGAGGVNNDTTRVQLDEVTSAVKADPTNASSNLSDSGLCGTLATDAPSVHLTVWSGPTATGTPIVDTDVTCGTSYVAGIWQYNGTSNQPAGQYTERVTQTDSAHATSDTGAFTFTLTSSGNGNGNGGNGSGGSGGTTSGGGNTTSSSNSTTSNTNTTTTTTNNNTTNNNGTARSQNTTQTALGAGGGGRAQVDSSGKFTVPGVPASCGAGPCAGTANATANPSTVKHRVVAAKKGKKTKKGNSPVVVGSTHFTLAAGQTAPVTIKLNGKALSVLKKGRALKVSVTITVVDATGAKATRTVGVTLKAAKPKAKNGHRH